MHVPCRLSWHFNTLGGGLSEFDSLVLSDDQMWPTQRLVELDRLRALPHRFVRVQVATFKLAVKC